jgi:hypothetical protein
VRRRLKAWLTALWVVVSVRLRESEAGLTTLEYVIGAGVILVILAAAIVAWNTGLAERIYQLVEDLVSG